MKITSITVFSYKVKYRFGTYAMSGGRIATEQPSIVVRLCSDTGHEGWAETAPLGSDYLPSSFRTEVAAIEELSEHVLGLDPRALGVLNEVMDRAMMGGTAAKAVVDIACWDLYGKAMDLPTHVLLGGAQARSLKAFSVVGVGSPEIGVKKAMAEVDKGVSAVQLKVGDDPLEDARRVKAIREALPDGVAAWADANGGWSLEQALTFARALGSTTVVLEQPCRTLFECAEVGRRTGLPITLDESILTLEDLITARAAGIVGINLKPSRVGGFTKAKLIRDAAVALKLTVTVDDTWGCALTTAQNLQLAVSTPRNYLRAVDIFAEWTMPLIADVPRMQEDGKITISDLLGNGFGAVDLELLGAPLFERQA